MKTFVLYHSNCPDGFGAAWAAWMHFQAFSPEADVSYLPVNYNQPLPEIADGSDVFIVDFSYPRDVLVSLAERCRVCVLDHHATAREALDGLSFAKFDMSKSGAVLTWEHFFPTRDVPEMLLYLQDRDLWQWKLLQSKEVNAGLWRGTPRDFAAWRNIHGDWSNGRTSYKQHLIEAGQAIAFADGLNVTTLCKHPIWLRILCYTVPAVNTPVLQSEVGHQLLQLHPHAPFAATWMTRSDGELLFSLRARSEDEVNVGIIAKEFGGGGHKAAAGFERSSLFEIRAGPMAENSKIEWCDHTFNPWRGCTKVSEGCAHCYAETLSKRNPAVLGEWGPGKPRVKASPAMWQQPLKWDREAGAAQHENKCMPRPRVFCASLADWLDDEVPIEYLADLLELIVRTPHLDWLLLTKRPQNWERRITDALAHVEGINGDWPNREPYSLTGHWLNEWTGGNAPANVWIGTTVENQARADERIPQLLSIPARVRFLSCEPLLGSINLRCIGNYPQLDALSGSNMSDQCPALGKIHWVICGGESGPGARPMNPDWARSLRDQCSAAAVPFFFKQWGEFVRDADIHAHPPHADSVIVPYGDGDPINYRRVYRVGKKRAGRELDGLEHNAFPNAP